MSREVEKGFRNASFYHHHFPRMHPLMMHSEKQNQAASYYVAQQLPIGCSAAD